ncbi:DUF1642 domain-containing protein [Lactococcus lactis]|uniref:DUF1642 domain-containing protein n=1 Tax=Lactococcus lactis TaxID=1358 RepID=UPI002659FACC|nr:DUF1642 domain-containing protein [Lactococcus lactis]WKG34480.1 DUF1642 domain-containing protein [Lactococcus lactis subsp. lactis]WKG35944.1 DUF1642 domain-containing protein [Lactococcus lactis subsp. lactis]
MTKFEEELFNKVPCKFELTTEAEYKKSTLINHFKNWHSDEEFQELFDKYSNLNDNYEKEVIRSSKLESQIIGLKSQLQQQALPVVPEDVDKAIKYLKKHVNSTFIELGDILTEKGFKWLNDFQFKDRRFGFGGLNNKLFILSHLAVTGYRVEKSQLFYLCEKNTNYYLNKSKNNGLELVPNPYFDEDNQFTQQEIDSMETGSYEQIKVEVEK